MLVWQLDLLYSPVVGYETDKNGPKALFQPGFWGVPRIRPVREPAAVPIKDDQAATAAYVAALVADLSIIARRSNLDTLGYLLDMVRLEAEGAAQGSKATR